jgi:hypothetical protein
MSLDTRPKSLGYFGLLPISKLGKDQILLFGGENPERSTYLFDSEKREMCKCNIYTGDLDRFMTNQLSFGEQLIAFGLTRMHIFDFNVKKFVGVKCYDF